MIGKGTLVQWQSNRKPAKGVVKDYYKFKTKDWADKYKYAYLIVKPNQKYVLKLSSDVFLVQEQ